MIQYSARSPLLSPPRLLGRQAQLDRVESLLHRAQSALVLVSGMVGMGKSCFLGETGARAKRQGWVLARKCKDEFLRITGETTEADFCTKLWCALDRPNSDTQPEEPQAEIPLDLLLGRLNALGQVLLLIDGYRANPTFTSWFGERFLATLKRGTTPVVVMVAEVSGELTTLTKFADETIQLGPLDRTEVHEYFSRLREQVAPPMKPEEMETYVEEAAVRPEILNGLLRLFRLVTRDEAAPSEP
jgi:hypothetical protein